jgi:hypothetical protein
VTRADGRAVGTAAARLARVYRHADAEIRRDGRRWYPDAAVIAREIAATAPHGIGPVRAAAVIAALSPRVRWAENVALARAACMAAGRSAGDPIFGDLAIDGAVAHALRGTLSLSADRARRILCGERPGDVLGGRKVLAFWRAICGDRDAVTVDVWAALAAGYDPDRLTDRRHRIITAAYRAAARRVGEDPRDFQAIVWLTIRSGAVPRV